MGLVMALSAGALAAAVTLVQAQTSPSIDVELTPHNSVPLNTAISATVTLSGLDPNEYSAVIFRADATQYKPGSYPEASNFLGDDIDRDLVVDVDGSIEIFTISVFEPCDLSIYAHFALAITLSKADSEAPGGKVILTTATTRFSLSRYLMTSVPTATPPNPDAPAWMEPDPTELEMVVHGDWHQFRFRSDVSKYLDHHLGVVADADLEGVLFAPGANIPSMTVKEACEQEDLRQLNWRRAINQPPTIGACTAGPVEIHLRPYNDEVQRLAVYSFSVIADRDTDPPPPPPPPPPTPTTSTRTSTGGGGGFGPAPVAPRFSDGFRATRDVAENTPAGEAVGKPVVATHLDDLTLEYTLSGADGALFAMDAETGQIRVGEGTELDFEAGRHTFTVNVTATDTSGTGALITVNIEITDIDLGPYDLDDNGRIERGEVIASISDYFKSIIGKDEVIRLIRLYFAG